MELRRVESCNNELWKVAVPRNLKPAVPNSLPGHLPRVFAKMITDFRSKISITVAAHFASSTTLRWAPSWHGARRTEEISQFHLLIAPQVDRNEIRLFALCCIVDLIHHGIP
jgi:hypothetical protein